ncbi:MAG: hypothetical protein Q7S79_02365 [bacterium]|nr:hypothetical protein [bacterium]
MRSEIGKFRTDPLSAEQLVTDLRAAMESLLPKERLAICLRFRLDEETTEEGVRSQADVGKLMQPNAVSRERARVLLAYGMSGLKHGQKGTGYGGVFGNYVGSDD